MIIGVHAGHNPSGMVACGAKGLICESTEARNVKDEVIRLLKEVGHTVVDCTVNDGTSASDVINKIVKKSNAQDLDLTVSIHFNAGASDKDGNGKSTGVEVLATEFSGIKKEVSTRICDNVAKLGFKNRGNKVRTNLGFLNKSKAKAILVECCFVDDADDVKLYDAKSMGRAIAEGIHGSSIEVKIPSSNNTVKPEVEKTETMTNTDCPFVVKIKVDSLNVRSGAGTSYPVVTTVSKGQAYTITEVKNGWGKLKSGRGFISIGTKYVEKVK